MLGDFTMFLGFLKLFGFEIGRIIENLFILGISIIFIGYLIQKYAWPPFRDWMKRWDDYQKKHEAEDKAYKEEQARARAEQSKAIGDLTVALKAIGEGFVDNSKRNDEKFNSIQKLQIETQTKNDQKFSELGERLLFMEGQLQQVPYTKWEEMNKLHAKVRDESIGEIPNLTETETNLESSSNKKSTED